MGHLFGFWRNSKSTVAFKLPEGSFLLPDGDDIRKSAKLEACSFEVFSRIVEPNISY